jgi:hypothetical protein
MTAMNHYDMENSDLGSTTNEENKDSPNTLYNVDEVRAVLEGAAASRSQGISRRTTCTSSVQIEVDVDLEISAGHQANKCCICDDR